MTDPLRPMHAHAAAVRPDSRMSLTTLLGVLGFGIGNLFAAASDQTEGLPAGVTLQPLLASTHAGAPGFTSIPASASGLTLVNAYDDPRMWGERFQEHAFGSIATGVAVGDFDRDGLPDLYLIRRAGPGRLYRNLGGLRFEDVSERATILPDDEWTSGACFVDIDGDGLLDLWVGRHAAPNRLYRNLGDGTFVESAADLGLDQVTSSVMAVFIDFDRDGDLDCYLVTNRLDARVRPGEPDVFLRNEGGRFIDVSRAANVGGGFQTFAAAVADFNRDGWPDAYVANDFGGPDFLYLNQRNGSFRNAAEEALPVMPYYAMGADVGDINRDGWFDVLVADMLPTDARAFLKNTAELMDLQMAEDTRVTPQVMRNMLFLNTGMGRFREIAQMAGLAATDWTWAALLADLDNDGWEDAYFTTGMFRDFMDADVITRLGMEGARPAAVWRRAPELRQSNLAFRNLGNLRFENVSREWGLDSLGISFGAATADLDRDGDLDLVVSNYEGTVSLLRNDGAKGGGLLIKLSSPGNNRDGVGATLRLRSASGRQTRFIGLARGVASGHEALAHFGMGNDNRVEDLIIEWPDGSIRKIENLPARGLLTITSTAGTPMTRQSLMAEPPPTYSETSASRGIVFDGQRANTSAAEGELQPLMPERFGGLGPGMAWGDVDGDGRADLYVAAAAGRPGTLLLARPNGSWEAAPSPSIDSSHDHLAPLLVDLDGDGDLDLVVTNGGPGGDPAVALPAVQVLRNDGRGNFARDEAAVPHAPPGGRYGAMAAADFDRDGQLDIAVGGRFSPGQYPRPPASLLLRSSGGRLENVTSQTSADFGTAGMVTALIWSDADGDGWLDLLAATDWGPIQLFRNEMGRDGRRVLRRDPTTGFDRLPGWWSSLVAADFDGDGRIDYAAGNRGLNTRYSASTDSPAVLVAADWGGNGRLVPIEARFDGPILRPWRGVTETLRAIGSRLFAARLLQRFPTFDAYSKASLEELFGTETLARADLLAVTEPRSGVWLNAGLGGFRFVPLPAEAQMAPVYGMAAGDYNGDGNADLLIVGNTQSHSPVAGRADGGVGVLLLGDGRGGFRASPPRESGIVVPGSARALTTLDRDRDGQAEFALTRDLLPGMLFEPRTDGMAGRPFSVSLGAGVSESFTAGIRVTVIHRDGRRQIGEIHAGAGYLSQSEAVLFFGAPPDNPPEALEVRWPAGDTTRHPWDGRPHHRIVRTNSVGK